MSALNDCRKFTGLTSNPTASASFARSNNKNRIYHKKIWSFFLDQPIEDIKSAPTFFSKNITVKEKLADIDVMIANNAVIKHAKM